MKRVTKRALVITFITLFIYDICSYIKYFILNDDYKIISVGFYKTIFDNKEVMHLSIIFLIFVSLIYFIKNFFKE